MSRLRARILQEGARALALCCICLAAPAPAQEVETVEIQVQQVAEGLYMLIGRGGNIGISAGEDGVFLIDDQYAPLTDQILQAVQRISDRPIRFVLNTHWHSDHTGGNENLGKAGVLIVAHDNVRERMSAAQFMEFFSREVPASPQQALPVVTFDSTATFHLNGGVIHAFHVPHAHTDGDSIVHFRDANVLHMGDIFFHRLYPFIDVGSGGSISGVIGAVDRALAMADGDTRIIPGHGPLATREDLRAYRDMLATVRERIAAMIAEGKDLGEIVAAKPTAEYDAQMPDNFIQPDRWVELVYQDLAR